MSRPLRLEAPGAIWHVTSRGNERREIFKDDADRRAWLDILAGVVGLHGWRVHAYVLMGNHYHLVLETPLAPSLSRGMRQLNGVYAQRFNRRHGRCGHLFQGRFHAVLVERESHLLELARYVVLNPVRAGIVETPAAWPWSSFLATAGLTAPPPWLETDSVLANFAASPATGRLAYGDFVAARTEASPWRALKRQIYLGSDAFVLAQTERASLRTTDPEVPRAQRCLPAPARAEVLATTCSALSLDPLTLTRRGHPSAERALIAYALRRFAAATGREIAGHLNTTSWGASRLARHGEALWPVRGPTLEDALRALPPAA